MRLARRMAFSTYTPTVGQVGAVIDVVASWQRDGMPVQLHPGDLGWHWRFGADTVARTLRVWARDDEVFAVGFLDEPHLIRLALSPAADQDVDTARRLVDDLQDPTRGVLPAGMAFVEARFGAALRSLLHERGWEPDEAWTPLRRDLTEPVEPGPLRIEVAGPDHLEDRVAVQRGAFDSGHPMTLERWHTMAAGTAYAQARCLVGYDDRDAAVATATVWSAGPGRPGLIEPLGVHRDHRRRGHGVSITVAAAAALQQLGASTAIVATPSSNEPAVATYLAGGFTADPQVTDFRLSRR